MHWTFEKTWAYRSAHPPSMEIAAKRAARAPSRGGCAMAFRMQKSINNVAAHGRVSRRSLLAIAGVVGSAGPLAMLEGARALTLFGPSLFDPLSDSPICQIAAT